MAVDGNQNLIRVWASGAYGPDFMYDVADELGLLLWTEFEFSDALYPVDPASLANVAAEAHYQVRRLNHHPSMAVWVGGNEVETDVLWVLLDSLADEAKRLGFQGALEQIFALKAQWKTLFLDTLIPPVFENSRSISYMPSSTNAGYQQLNFSLSPPLVPRYQNLPPVAAYAPVLLANNISAADVQKIINFPADSNQSTVNYANTDFYDYFLPDFFDTDAYPLVRFAVEFGFFSYPSIQTWSQVLPSKNLRFNDSILLKRNHQDDFYASLPTANTDFLNLTIALNASGVLTTAIEKYYPLPNLTDPLANFSAWCQTSQIFQADLYRSEIQFYRWGSSQPWRQLGSLYWQLNDIWQTSSWAGIEYDGRWKYLHYVMQDIYKPVIISPFYNSSNGQLNVTVTSDLWSEVNGSAQLTWYNWEGEQLEPPMLLSFAVGAINSTRIYDTILNSTKLNLTNSVLRLNITASGKLPNSNGVKTFTHESSFHPIPLREAALVDPGIELSYNESTKKFSLTATKGVAMWTWLDYPEGPVVTFDENAFTLMPGMSKEIGYTVRKGSDIDWLSKVTVRSIWNNTLSE
jgi:beta-mannosidase